MRKLKLFSLVRSSGKIPYFNSLEDNYSVIYPKWNFLLTSLRQDGYNPEKYKSWISLEDCCEAELGSFIIRGGTHRIALLKYLLGADYKVKVCSYEAILKDNPSSSLRQKAERVKFIEEAQYHKAPNFRDLYFVREFHL